MKLLLSKAVGLVLFLALSASYTYAQCPVTAYASKTTISCGDPVTLSAVASGCVPLNNNFNNGTIGTWQATTGAVVTNGNGSPNASYNCVGTPPEGPNCLWMGATVAGVRNVTTQDYDLTNCGGGTTNSGSICFWMKYSTQGGPDPCEGIDLPAEGISLQYSTNGGTNWTTIQYYDPNGGFDPVLTNWNYYCLTIPNAAIGPNTRFRWLQSENSGAGFDTWGLDDVSIILNGPGYTYDWAHDAQGPSATSNTPDVNPTSTTTYTVTYTNGIQSCTSNVTVNVLLPTLAVSSNKVLVCEGTPVNLNAQSSLVAPPITNCAVNSDATCDPQTMIADEVSIGTGTTVQTFNNGSQPVFGNFGDAFVTSHIMYRASELTAAGMVAGRINNLSFDIATVLQSGGTAPSASYSEVKIDMGCTSVNSMTNFTNPSVSFSNVFPPQTVVFTPGIKTFFFAQSYNWDGVSNIVIRVCWRVAPGGSANDMDFYAMTREGNVGFNAVYNSGSNFEAGQCATSGATSSTGVRPNTIFGYCKPRTIALNYSWTSSPVGFTSNIKNPSATPSGPTYYICSVNNTGSPAGCAVKDSVLVNTYKPTVSVNPNPANICPPGTTSAALVSTATTNTTFPAQRTFNNNTAQAVPDAGGGALATCGTAGASVNSVIAVTGINPATLAANPVYEVAVNMTTANNQDYRIELISPSGSVILLKQSQTGAGQNLTNTRFRTGSPAITTGAAPYNNVYGPNQPYANLTGNINGNWTLRVTDLCKPLGTGTSTGSLLSWSITFNTQNYISNYAWSPAAGLSSTNTANTTASPTNSTVYTLTVTDYVGCSNSVQVPVNVSTAPSIPVNNASICAGNSATLTAVPFDAGGGTYSWSPGGATTQTINVSPGSTTGYTVSYSSGGCTGTGTGTVTVSPTPTLSFNPQTICSGQTINVTATPSQTGGTYSWTSGQTTQTISVSPTTSRYYVCTYSLNGCSVTDSVLITVNPTPTVTVNNQTICAGAGATLTATPSIAGGSYSWTPGGQNTPMINVNPASTTTYTVNYTLNGCSTTNTGTVTVNPIPTVTVNNPSICGGQTATITANATPAGGTYSWSPGGQTTPSITVTPASTTSYTVTYTSLNGCTKQATSTVTVGAASSVTVNDPTVCAGTSATLTAVPGNAGGTFLWSPGGATTASITVSPAATANYTVTYTNNSCSASDVATVTVNPYPIVTLSNATICQGGSATLTPTVSTGGGSYAWTPTSQTTPSITVSPATTTNYSVIYTLNGCADTAANTVTVAPALSATLSGGGTICSGQTTSLTVNFSGTGPYNLVYNDGTTNQTINGINANPYTFTIGNAGNYSLVSVSNASCTGTVSGSANVVVNTPVNYTNLNGVCDGLGNYTISFEITGGDPATYSVTGMNGGTISASAPYIFTSTPIDVSTPNYSFTVTDANGCNTLNITGNQTCGCIASATISGGGAICPGETATITLNMTGTGPWDVEYTNGATTTQLTGIPTPYTFNVTTGGTYTVNSVLDATACAGSTNGSATVTVKPQPTVAINLQGNDSICLGQSATFVATPSQVGGSYSWSNGGTGNSITVTPGTAGLNQFTVTYNLNGCLANDDDSVRVIDLPTVVSNDTTICIGSPASLFAQGSPNGGTYLWTPVNQSGSTISVSPSANSNYQVTYTLDGCSANDISTVTVSPAPNVDFQSATICEGDQTTLMANVDISGGNFLWSPGNETTQSIMVSPNSTTNYSVTYTVGNCSASANGSVTVNPVPTITAANDTICDGEQAQLVAVVSIPNGTFTWGPGTFANNDTITDSPNTTTTYTVDYTVNGCSANTTADVIVNPSPSLNIPSTTVCNGTPATLTATTSNPGGVYNWSPGSFGNTNSITVSPSSTTTYYLNYTLNGCTVLDSATVQINNSSPVVVNNATICQGDNATLTASPAVGGGTFMWSPGGQTTPSITVSPINNTTYTVVYTLNGCTSDSTGNVTVNPVPTVTVQNDSVAICAGGTATLVSTASLPNGTYTWLNPPASGQNTASITVSPAAPTMYYVQYNLNGCLANDSGFVQVNQIPTLTATGDSICEGELGILTAVTNGDPNTITWSPGAYTGDTVYVSTNTNTQYIANITQFGCSNADTVTVVVTPLPTASATNSGPYCVGSTIELFGNSSTATNFDWTGPNGYAQSGQNVNRPNAQIIDSGVYQLTVSINGCTAIEYTTVTMVQPSQSVITPAGPFCGNDSPSTLVVNFPGGTWSGSGIINNNTGVFDPASATIGNNTITYTPAAGACQTSATQTVVVNAVPNVMITPIDEFGCAPFNTGFNDNTVPSSGSVLWDFGNGLQSTSLVTAYTSYPTPGLYTVTLTSTSLDGCTNSATFTNIVESLNNSVADFDWNPSEISSAAPIVDFINNSQFSDEFTWIFGQSGTSNDDNPTFDFGSLFGNVEVTLIANNAGNCPDTITKELFIKEELIYYVPNTFTPDGDKFNQTFSPVFVSGFDPKDFELLIFNRWGELIYETHDHTRGWDGTYLNRLVQDGVYNYVFRFKRKEDDDKVEVSGLINVIR